MHYATVLFTSLCNEIKTNTFSFALHYFNISEISDVYTSDITVLKYE